MIKILILSLALQSAGALPLSTLPNSFREGLNAPKEIPVSVLTVAEANALFKDFANNKDIPFDGDGQCFARATAMGQMAAKKGITVARLYAEGQLAVAPKEPLQPILWQYHVAPVIKVALPNGEPELRVLDPSLFKKPVPVEEWLDIMKFTGYEGCREENPNLCSPFVPKIKKTYFGNQYQFWPLADKKKDNRRYRESYELPDLTTMKEAFAESRQLTDRMIRLRAAEANQDKLAPKTGTADSQSVKSDDFFSDDMLKMDVPVGEFFEDLMKGVQ